MNRMSLLASVALVATMHGVASAENHWTLLFYGAANNSCEETIMDDFSAMKEHFVDGQGVELIVLLDRMEGFSGDARAFGEDFVDTRLYRITRDRVERLDGAPYLTDIHAESDHEANVGDPETLRDFIRYGKENHPARHYGLIFYSHGDGRAMCFDQDSDDDPLFPAEISATLTKEDSVDLIGFDVCSMGGAAMAYEWRPGNGGFEVSTLVASASVSMPWPYERIMPRLRSDDVDPAALTPSALGALIVDTLREHRAELYRQHPDYPGFISWASLDLRHADDLKRAVDALAVKLSREGGKALAESVRGQPEAEVSMNYLHFEDGPESWLRMPYFDVYDFASRLSRSDGADPDVRECAKEVAKAADALVGTSFGGGKVDSFHEGRNGVYLIFPAGDRQRLFQGRDWSQFGWYRPTGVDLDGGFAWCRDGAIAGNGHVENWFELLDAWYDVEDEDGGLNGYRW